MLPMVQSEPVFFNCGVHSAEAAATSPATLPPSLASDSDVDEFVDIFFDVDVAVSTLPRIESCDLQLGDTWRGMQSKMSVTAPVKKIRKKSDNTSQSQKNKCHNEKRRRELENETINQLEELLGTCLAEVKQPDKNGIVREATRQIQEVLKRRRECPAECPLRACLSPVQAGEVSSTQPPCAGLHYSELTTLIEALKHYTGSLGWVLLEINSKAEVECVTENIKDLILQDRTELYKKSIFSLLHVKDHAKLRPLLRNIQTFTWGSGEIDKFQAIQACLLIKNSNGTDSAGSVECVIHAAPVRGSSSEEAGSVMCVIRRCEDASAALLPGDGGPPAITAKHSDNIVFRLDSNFTILSCDLSGVENFINCPIPLADTRYLELVDSSDRNRVVAHLQEAPCHPAPPVISEPFRLRLGPDRPFFRVVARSRLFQAKPTSGDPDFIMSTHNVLGDEDLDLQLETEGPCPPVGGPLMTSVANGESSACEARYRSPMSDQFINDFELDPWTSTLLGDMSSEESKDRKDSAAEGPSQPGTPHATRAPSTSGENPPAPPAEEPNRLRILLSKKPLPGNDAAVNSNNRILKDLLKQEDEEGTGSETSAPHTPHTPLTPHTPQTPHTPAAAVSPLHSAQPHSRPAHSSHMPHAPHSAHAMQQSHHNNSDVLLRILNDKTDEEHEERRNSGDGGRGVSQPSVLSQLLSNTNGPSGNGRSQDAIENYQDRYPPMKRKMEESKTSASSAKRATPENQQQVTSSAVSVASSSASATASSPSNSSSAGMSQLCAKNQILVSLLARQQTTPTTPLPLPNPNLRPGIFQPRHAPPPPIQRNQSALSNILTGVNHRASNVNGGAGGAGGAGGVECGGGSHLQMVLQGGGREPYAASSAAQAHPPTTLHYANTPPFQTFTHQAMSGNARAQGAAGEGELPADQTLSDLLDAVIETLPDSVRPPPEVNVQQRQGNEKNAVINAIRQSLMQYENPVVSSPPAPPVYSVQSPGSCAVSGGAMFSGSNSNARARAIAEQHRARLLDMQRLQQMLVSPEAAEQPQADLGSTINALVSATPPNVALTRTDYHHVVYNHPSNQMAANYGTNKITSSQQNPMLSRQLNVSGSGGYSGHGAHAAALHTPAAPQPYLRGPRPHLVGGYYEDGGAAYCEYARCGPQPPHAPQPPPAPPHAPPDHQLSCGGGAAGRSEYVRNELRAVVAGRTRPEMHPLHPPDVDPLMTFDMTAPGGGSVVGGRATSASTNSWESQQSNPSTTEAGSAEAASAAGGDETQTAGGAGGAGGAGAAAKASLLQKLLSQ